MWVVLLEEASRISSESSSSKQVEVIKWKVELIMDLSNCPSNNIMEQRQADECKQKKKRFTFLLIVKIKSASKRKMDLLLSAGGVT